MRQFIKEKVHILQRDGGSNLDEVQDEETFKTNIFSNRKFYFLNCCHNKALVELLNTLQFLRHKVLHTT